MLDLVDIKLKFYLILFFKYNFLDQDLSFYNYIFKSNFRCFLLINLHYILYSRQNIKKKILQFNAKNNANLLFQENYVQTYDLYDLIVIKY